MHKDDTAVVAGAKADPYMAVHAEDVAHVEIAARMAGGRGETLGPCAPILGLGKVLCHLCRTHYIATAATLGV